MHPSILHKERGCAIPAQRKVNRVTTAPYRALWVAEDRASRTALKIVSLDIENSLPCRRVRRSPIFFMATGSGSSLGMPLGYSARSSVRASSRLVCFRGALACPATGAPAAEFSAGACGQCCATLARRINGTRHFPFLCSLQSSRTLPVFQRIFVSDQKRPIGGVSVGVVMGVEPNGGGLSSFSVSHLSGPNTRKPSARALMIC